MKSWLILLHSLHSSFSLFHHICISSCPTSILPPYPSTLSFAPPECPPVPGGVLVVRISGKFSTKLNNAGNFWVWHKFPLTFPTFLTLWWGTFRIEQVSYLHPPYTWDIFYYFQVTTSPMGLPQGTHQPRVEFCLIIISILSTPEQRTFIHT